MHGNCDVIGGNSDVTCNNCDVRYVYRDVTCEVKLNASKNFDGGFSHSDIIMNGSSDELNNTADWRTRGKKKPTRRVLGRIRRLFRLS